MLFCAVEIMKKMRAFLRILYDFNVSSECIMILFFSAALAADLPLPIAGTTSTLSDCTTKVVAALSGKKAGNLIIDQARAEAICLQAKGDYALAVAQAQAILNRSAAEAVLIVRAGNAAGDGGSVAYRSNGLTVELTTGPAAEWKAYGDAVGSGQSLLMAPGGMFPAGGDPNLWRLSGAPTGYMMAGSTPALPQSRVPETASCGTAQECEAALKAATDLLAEEE
jgi:hypothetical protein